MYYLSQLFMYLKFFFNIPKNIICIFINKFIKKINKSILTKSLQFKCIEILHKSKNFLVVNKPYDMVINSNNPNIKESVQLVVCRMFPNLINPNLYHQFYFVHRLDYATSGVMCIALHKQSAQAVSTAFEERTVQKYYLALVHGHINKPTMIIDIPIGNDIREVNGNHEMCTNDEKYCHKPRRSCTSLLVLEKGYRNKKAVTKILLYPKTGRRHQLRVHCKHIGHVIVGDYTYSGKTDIEPYRTFLHAFRLTINNTIENLDVQTVDPFTSFNLKNEWRPTNVIRNLDENAFFDVKQLLLDI